MVTLGKLSILLRREGRLDAALDRLTGQEKLCRQMGERRVLATSLGSQALVLMDRDDNARPQRFLRAPRTSAESFVT